MSDQATTEARVRQFAELVRQFTPPPPKRYAALRRHHDGIADLRQKGAPFSLIATMLRNAGVDVSADTVRRYCREHVEPRVTSSASTASKKRPAKAEPPPPKSDAPAPAAPSTPAPAPRPATPPPPAPALDTPRVRGPRIADVRNL
jgi:hypothetical protein